MDSLDGPCLTKPKTMDDKNGLTTSTDEDQSTPSTIEKLPILPVDIYASSYNMEHKRRGLMYVFADTTRSGSQAEIFKVTNCFENLGFDVNVYRDLKLEDIRRHVAFASQQDHSDCDCFAVIVLAHGKHERVYAKDCSFNPETEFFKKFTAENCPTLTGKPKLFFIASCQGDDLDPGVKVKGHHWLEIRRNTETDGNFNYTWPIHADFLIGYAAYKDFKSLRHPAEGSYYVSALCQEFEQTDKDGKLLAETQDIHQILVNVNRRIAINVTSNTKEEADRDKKQIPYFKSSLTRDLYFKSKRANITY